VPDVVMPRLSDSMEEGTILRWLRAEGELVGAGDPLVEIETDKATVEHEATAAGRLHIIAAAGETLPIGRRIATIGEADGDRPGAGGAASGKAKGSTTVEELSRARQLVARRVAESRATVPDQTVTAVIDMEACTALLGLATYDDMVLRACALALREHPRVNGAYRDGHYELHSRVNVGFVAHARDGLLVPTIFDADAKPLAQIAQETAALTERVRNAAITPPELSGGTFTLSSLGAFAVRRFATVITPGQAAALAIGAVEQRVAVVAGEAQVRHQLEATLSCDHRILYAADAARFLERVRELLEEPSALASTGSASAS
jgi:pyruvate dehydrogenase E2 component (dihydrolipoamide acetyltransferase)